MVELNTLWVVLVIFCTLFAIVTGKIDEVSASLLQSGQGAVTLALSLAGAYALWCGLLAIMEKSGAIASLSKWIRPVFRLFPGVKADTPAGRAVATNLAANLLGLGNAATPAGLEAMEEMRGLSPLGERPSDAMCMFLVINSSSIQLIPTTVISLRAAAGSANPADILLPTLCATACSTLFAVLAMKLWFWGEERAFGRLGGGRSAAIGNRRGSPRGVKGSGRL